MISYAFKMLENVEKNGERELYSGTSANQSWESWNNSIIIMWFLFKHHWFDGIILVLSHLLLTVIGVTSKWCK